MILTYAGHTIAEDGSPVLPWVEDFRAAFTQTVQTIQPIRAPWSQVIARGGSLHQLDFILHFPPQVHGGYALSIASVWAASLPPSGDLTWSESSRSCSAPGAVLTSARPAYRRGVAVGIQLTFTAAQITGSPASAPYLPPQPDSLETEFGTPLLIETLHIPILLDA